MCASCPGYLMRGRSEPHLLRGRLECATRSIDRCEFRIGYMIYVHDAVFESKHAHLMCNLAVRTLKCLGKIARNLWFSLIFFG